MKTVLSLIMASLFLYSCSPGHRLNKSYAGKPVEVLKKDFGHPATVFKNQNDSIYVFEEKEELRSTEISQGKLTLDPIVTPAVVKIKRLYFTIKNGLVADVRVEEEYVR